MSKRIVHFNKEDALGLKQLLRDSQQPPGREPPSFGRASEDRGWFWARITDTTGDGYTFIEVIKDTTGQSGSWRDKYQGRIGTAYNLAGTPDGIITAGVEDDRVVIMLWLFNADSGQQEFWFDSSDVLPGHDLFSLLHTDTNPDAVVADGDMVYRSIDNEWDTLPIGANGKVLKSDGSRPIWSDGTSAAHTLLDATTHTDSVTAIPAAGDIIIADSDGKWNKLPVGDNGDVLTVDAGMPAWADNSNPMLDGARHSDTAAYGALDANDKGTLIIGTDQGGGVVKFDALGVGPDGSMLQADSAQAYGAQWVSGDSVKTVGGTGSGIWKFHYKGTNNVIVSLNSTTDWSSKHLRIFGRMEAGKVVQAGDPPEDVPIPIAPLAEVRELHLEPLVGPRCSGLWNGFDGHPPGMGISTPAGELQEPRHIIATMQQGSEFGDWAIIAHLVITSEINPDTGIERVGGWGDLELHIYNLGDGEIPPGNQEVESWLYFKVDVLNSADTVTNNYTDIGNGV